jgi:tRNA threonylcarbamoyladenosine biosynthesis protein TsaB
LIVLAIDTCLEACAAAVWTDGRVLAERSEPMRRGHQERLANLVAEVMDEAGTTFGQLDRIGVSVGPGSFTGLRVGLAFAKGLGLALDRPVVGVGVLEALAAGASGEVIAAAIAAPREQVCLQIFGAGRPLMGPDCLAIESAAARLVELTAGRALTLVGPGAGLLTAAAPSARVVACVAPEPALVARLAAAARAPLAPPRPLYLRSHDATPSAP